LKEGSDKNYEKAQDNSPVAKIKMRSHKYTSGIAPLCKLDKYNGQNTYQNK
jgi:hypothetical protein